MTDCAWTLIDEARYLARIGQTYAGTRAIPRAEMLRRYLSAQQRRVRWADMDRTEALGMAMAALTQAVQDELEQAKCLKKK